jgi:DNA-binding NarL/FixJ family response regulator
MEPIKLMIVDDHPLFRQGLVDVLDTDDGIAVVAAAANGDAALCLAEEQRPDIVLMDVNLPDMNGLQVTRRILSVAPQTKIIILTGYDDAEQVYHAIQLGAVAYCAKDVPPEGLLNTIHAVYDGNYVIHNQVLTDEEIAAWFQRRAARYTTYPTEEQPSPTNPTPAATTTSFTPLSPREMEILELVTRGASNKEIAHRLTISQQTVKNHMTAVLRKLRVDDRTQAAVYALRHGWVRLDSATPPISSE